MERFNSWFANHISAVVATMWCFYAFNLLSVPAVIQALQTHSAIIIINAISSNWLQLILLPAIMVYQKIQGEKSEKRAEEDHKMIKAQFEDLKTVLLELKDLQSDNEHEKRELDELQANESHELVVLQRLLVLMEELKRNETTGFSG